MKYSGATGSGRDWLGFAVASLLWFTFTVGSAKAQSSRDTIADVQPRMVKLFGAGGLKNLYAYSTGFLVSRQGHVATVWNHVLDTDGLAAVLSDGRRFSAKVVGYEPQLDLAVIKLDADDLDLPYFDLKEAVSVGPGTRILGFSNMFKVATGDEPMSVIHGVIASRTRLTARRGAYSVPYDGLVYIVDAVTNNSGSTGGVITTRDGRLVGMIGKELRNRMSNTWINYAMPVTELREPIAQIISGDYTTRSKPENAQNPGRYSPLDFGLVMVPDVLYRTPAYIDSVLSGSQAGRAGLQPDDLVLFVNDKLIQSYRDLASALGHLEAGDPCRLTVRRNAELISVELQAERKPAG